MSTEHADMGPDREFREFVRFNASMGYGRMAQIIDEEWRRVDPKRGGLLVICGGCGKLIHANGGKVRS